MAYEFQNQNMHRGSGASNKFPRRVRSNVGHRQTQQQLCLPGFRERPFAGMDVPIRVARWVLRVLARTEARDGYLAYRHASRLGIDRVLEVNDDERPENVTEFNRLVVRRLDEVEGRADEDEDTLRANIALLASELDLSETECEFLEFRCQIWTQPALGELTGLFDDGWPDSKLARVLAVAFDRDSSEVLRALSRNGKLRRTGLLRIGPMVNEDFIGKTAMQLGLCNALLQPAGSLEELLSYAVQTAPPATLSIDDFPYLQAELTAISDYLWAASRDRLVGVNILLHGAPGVGKTELARALPHALGLRAFEVRSQGDCGNSLDLETRLYAYMTTQSLLGAAGKVAVIFDEIENALPRGVFLHEEKDSIKAWLNQALESNPLPTFWIANSIGRIDPAYARRFDIVLEIKPPPRNVRRQILEQCLDGLPVRPSWIDQQASDAELPPATAKRIAKVLQATGEMAPERVEAIYELFAKGHKIASGRPTRSSYPRIDDYRLEWVNVDADLPGLCAALHRRPKGRLLFHGPPGTGKTALAHHLAEAIDRPLLVKRASDLLSKYLGETEKNLRDMFDEARDDAAVLLLDEADSFLQDRTLAHRNWEVTEVNELLTQMEAFDGLFICATNFLDRLDPAASRRFGLKLEFLPLRPEQASSLFVAEYARMTGRDPRDDERAVIAASLAQLPLLTPGDFAAAGRQWELLDRSPAPAELVEALRSECAVKPGGKHRQMGF